MGGVILVEGDLAGHPDESVEMRRGRGLHRDAGELDLDVSETDHAFGFVFVPVLFAGMLGVLGRLAGSFFLLVIVLFAMLGGLAMLSLLCAATTPL